MFPQDLWPPYLVGWRVKLKDHLQQTPVTPSSSGQLITRQIKNVVFSLPRGLLLLNLTRSYFLNSKCVYQCMVCKAEVSANTSYKEYYGASKRGSNLDTLIIHNLSETYFINVTELSEYLWTLEANRTEYHLKWSTKLYAS